MDSENKEELINFLTIESVSHPYFPDNKDLYMTSKDKVVHTGRSCNMDDECSHEEANTRIVVHIMHALNTNDLILIRTGDTDVVIIVLSQFHRFLLLNSAAIIWIAFGSGRNLQMLNVNTIATYLGTEKCIGLPMFHAVSGCDTICGLKMKGKRLWWNTWKKFPFVTAALTKVFNSPFEEFGENDLDLLECFVCRLYDPKSNICKVNELRLVMFSQRIQDVEKIPPTKDALLQHFRRALFQASVWASSHQSVIPDHNPISFGWTDKDDQLVPLWMTQDTALKIFSLQIKCSCKKQCSNACTCKKEKLTCSQLCKCSCF